MSIDSQPPTESPLLDSSVTSLRRPKKSNSEISKTYKHASQLYLTRRLAECYEALQPVIRPAAQPEKEVNGHGSQGEDESAPRAPIALASTSQRIKIWSLYAALLNAIVELGDEEGKRDFGNKQYREIVRNVQSGEVWEQAVRDGYLGREASVDAEVVYNLSNLLLQQAQDQKVNQTRLETYLSSSAASSLQNSSIDFSAAFNDTNGSSFHSNGMDTPKDLNSRIKILELFTLHVLPQNNEWDYARSFVANSDILDEERREAFLQTLTELQEVKEQEEAEAEAAADLVGFNEETEDEEPNQDRIQMDAGDSTEEAVYTNGHSDQPTHRKSPHRRTSGEVDYGIDDNLLKARTPQRPSQSIQPTKAVSSASSSSSPSPSSPSSSSAPQPHHSPMPSVPPASTASVVSGKTISPPAQTSRKASTIPARRNISNGNAKSNKSTNSPPRSGVSKFILVLSNLTRTIAQSLTKNPTQLFRTLIFLFAFLAVLARKDVRDRLKRMLGDGWVKVRQTAGMGVKVSYV